MNPKFLHYKMVGLFTCTLALAAGLQAQSVSPVVVLRATDPTALEGTSTGAFTLIRYGDTNSTLSVNVEIAGTAVNGVDYSAISSGLTLPAGYYAVDVPVLPLLDTTNRGNKTVVLTLQPNAAYRVAGSGKATVKIVDDIFNIPPPTVAITSPTDGSVVTAPAMLTLEATVSDPELPVQSVSFYVDDAFVGRVTNSPYTLTVKATHPGLYAVFSRAVDEFGKSAVSEPVHVTVSAAPVVTLLTPGGTNYDAGQFVILDAQIGDPNEPIKSVTFYLNSKVLGTVTNAPYTWTWNTTVAGTNVVQAVAVDANTGKKGDSAKVDVVVLPFVGGN